MSSNKERARLAAIAFVQKATEKHKSKYSYEKVVYQRCKSKIIITCPKHGDFMQTPNMHLHGQGCPTCKVDLIKTTNRQRVINDLPTRAAKFIKTSTIVHKNKYDYAKVEYKDAFTKVTIICPLHGEFEQTPSNHTQHCGCPVCGVDSLTGGYSAELFEKHPEIKKQQSILYLVKMNNTRNTDPVFLKIGITTQPVNYRLSRCKKEGIHFEIIHEFTLPLFDAFLLEQDILKRFRNDKFFSNDKFDGYTECFKLSALENILLFLGNI